MTHPTGASLTPYRVDGNLQRPSRPAPSMAFRTPEQMCSAFMLRSALRNWPFTMADFEVLLEKMPTRLESQIDSVITLDIWLGDLSRTFNELWHWVSGTYPRVERTSSMSDTEPMRLVHDRYGREPSVRWGVLNLIAGGMQDYPGGRAAKDARDENAAGLQVLTAAALHGDWPRDFQVRLPGIELTGERWLTSGVPDLIWTSTYDYLSLGVMTSTYPDNLSTLPTFERLEPKPL